MRQGLLWLRRNMNVKKMRDFLKDDLRLTIDFSRSDQNRGVPAPPVQKEPRADQARISLPLDFPAQNIDLMQALDGRRSCRAWSGQEISLGELSFLLWATQGVRKNAGPSRMFRTVPSAGCRHAFETYVLANAVQDLERGLYRYLPLEHELILEDLAGPDFSARQHEAVLGQSFVPKAAAVFVWAAIPYRMEWRYLEAAHRVMALDAGHICQNLYLAVQAVGCGTCAVAAYHQKALDELLGVDGVDEFAVYLAPVGKVKA